MSGLLAISFPAISPVALSVGPFDIRWYGLAYAAGMVLGWLYVRRLVKTPRLWAPQQGPMPSDFASDLLIYCAVGVLAGGRLGNVLLYEPAYYWQHPWEILEVWRGGMAFHGGVIGVIISLLVLARVKKLPFLTLTDLAAAAVPIGLLLGRLANFANAELWGRVSEVPWAMVFPDPEAGPLPRHPSQLYEAVTEGLLLFALLAAAIYLWQALARPGMLSGLFLAGYALARSFCEFYREDTDPQIGLGLMTSGQIYSLPMLALGVAVLIYAARAPSARQHTAAPSGAT